MFKKILIKDDENNFYLINQRDRELFIIWLRNKYEKQQDKYQYHLTKAFTQCKIESLNTLIIKDYELRKE